MTFAMTVEDVDQAPASTSVLIFEAEPDTAAEFTFDDDADPSYTTETDEDGSLSTDFQVPTVDAGTYTLHVTIGAETVDVDFEVLADPLDADPDAGDDPVDPEPPIPDDPVQRWRLIDQLTTETYDFPRNPVSWNGPPERTIYYNHDSAVAPGGNILTWAAAGRAWPFEFSGRILNQAEYDDLLEWANKRRRFWLVDHRNVVWYVTFLQFDARARIDRSVGDWSHDYTMRVLAFNKPVDGAPFGWDDDA